MNEIAGGKLFGKSFPNAFSERRTPFKNLFLFRKIWIMCLLAILYRIVPDHPIVVAANRDEFCDRPGEPPRVWDAGVPFLAPRDPRAGGTWIGCNAHRMIAAITNRAQPNHAGAARSRGLLCTDVLGSASPSEAAELMENEVARNEYSGFNLFCADPDEAFIAHYDGELQVTRLAAGTYIIGNRDLNDETCWKVLRTRKLLVETNAADLPSLISDLKALCADHAAPGPDDQWQGNDDEAICVHGKEHGTLSSTIIAVGRDSGDSIYLHAQGRPCSSAYVGYELDFRAEGT